MGTIETTSYMLQIGSDPLEYKSTGGRRAGGAHEAHAALLSIWDGLQALNG